MMPVIQLVDGRKDVSMIFHHGHSVRGDEAHCLLRCSMDQAQVVGSAAESYPFHAVQFIDGAGDCTAGEHPI